METIATIARDLARPRSKWLGDGRGFPGIERASHRLEKGALSFGRGPKGGSWRVAGGRRALWRGLGECNLLS